MAWRAVPLAPVLLGQAVWVKARAARLPEADGDRAGRQGDGAPLSLLIVGDSSAAGVGVETLDEALPGQLVRTLAPDFAVDWTLQAVSGATAKSTIATLRAMPSGRFDAAVIALGVNDTKNGVPAVVWRRRYDALLTLLRGRFGVRRVYASAVPPMGLMPLLPRPLRTVLGSRSSQFDAILSEVLLQHDARRIAMNYPVEPGYVASDGFHPGPALYAAWADRIATAIRADF